MSESRRIAPFCSRGQGQPLGRNCREAEFVFLKLRYNSHAIKFTLLKCAIQWFGYAHRFVGLPSLSNFKAFSLPPKETFYSLAVTLHFLFTPAPGNLIYFLCGFAYSGYFMRMESYLQFFRVWLFSQHDIFEVHPCIKTLFFFMIQ